MKKYGWVIILVVLVLGVAGGFYFSMDGGFSKEEEKQSDEEIVESMAKRYMRAYEKLDSKAIIKMMYKEEADDYEDVLEERFEALEDEDFKVKEWEITDVKKIEGTKLENIQDDFDDEYDVKVTKVFRVKIKVKVKFDGETETSKSDLYFGKIDGKWCLLGGNVVS